MHYFLSEGGRNKRWPKDRRAIVLPDRRYTDPETGSVTDAGVTIEVAEKQVADARGILALEGTAAHARALEIFEERRQAAEADRKPVDADEVTAEARQSRYMAPAGQEKAPAKKKAAKKTGRKPKGAAGGDAGAEGGTEDA